MGFVKVTKFCSIIFLISIESFWVLIKCTLCEKKIKMNTFVGVMFCSRNHIWNFVWKNDYCNGLGPDKIRKSNVDNTTNDEKG